MSYCFGEELEMIDDITQELAETLKELRTKFDSRQHLGPSMVRVDAILDRYAEPFMSPEKPKMTINLKDYEGKLVVATLRNEWMVVSLVCPNEGFDCCPYSIDGRNYTYNGRFFIDTESPYDIIDIVLADEDPVMTEVDISKVLIEGDTATIMGVKYQRVEEPKPPTLNSVLLTKTQMSRQGCENICKIMKEWISQYSCDFNDRYAEGYEDALNELKENLK